MIWIIAVVIVVLIAIVMLGGKSEEAEAPAKPQWRDPSGAEAHLVFLAAMGEGISAYEWASLLVQCCRENGEDQVHMTFWGVELTAAFQ